MKRTKLFVFITLLIGIFIQGNRRAEAGVGLQPELTSTKSSIPAATAPLIWFLSPLEAQTVSGRLTVVFAIPSKPSSTDPSAVWWTRLQVNGVTVATGYNDLKWDTTTGSNGYHLVRVDAFAYGGTTPIGGAQVYVIVNNGGQATVPTPTPIVRVQPTVAPTSKASATVKPTVAPTPQTGATPTATPTPIRLTPTPRPTATPAPGTFPLSDAAAAALVDMSRLTWEPRPDNNTANHTTPTTAQLAQVQSLAFLNADGNRMLHAVTGNFTGTTDEILQWAAIKWGFPPDMARANAVVESYWHQSTAGDMYNGVSLGILQIKSINFTGTCPNGWNATSSTSPVLELPDCLSHLMTAFAADYKYMYQRACVAGDIGYLASDTRELAGYPKYINGPGANNSVLGCIGNWYSGSWYDSGSVAYQQTYNNALAARQWSVPGF